MDTNVLISFGVSLIATLIVMPILIPYLHKIKFSQTEREEGLASHQVKTGTPTMGGIVFVLIPILVCGILNPAIFTDFKMLIVILAYLGYATIGFIDDFIIVVQKNNNGLSPKVKFLMQSFLAILFFFMYKSIGDTSLWIPILDTYVELGLFFFVVIFIMFTGESNAVNLTDGLDGLCAGTVSIAIVPFIFFAFRADEYDLAIFLIAVLGALIGYLRFNTHPAKIFMGDTGSLALGGLLAGTALILKMEILLVIIGGIFVIEALSVALQVISFKLRGKRIFKMAPIHHHFEMSGMSETKVVVMFYIIGIILATLGYLIGVM
ncbi:phospho-N-acetylmuramoyl-pentapeptide-transferase [Breznakia sp. PF5-3]|uniref:phospho-N-acetylmuramoyl-pentapeptide- transferase n=1 Tax=unclassified Breznakia TaxID=2623764 RepID=UPI0024072D8D|nr:MULTISPECIES: phospho-N-acetylmuramoyl-pentapeptide-transferase [unclassified Breznakia]MDF9824674.1 phospho-N-acetylmuramoyl-pentapeptide-transferase [Breznakia sp. PM6-1]MDF9835659.1 phospho-N-acetylmuramoyl-pentapeptide-transferase [Breznakia sp. PF5-3]MDF9837676.1 phospho-N-acetylmuramoyl-pentapeptide-transferase [Breznakia sp. PFB2-8]MDF9859540.1 phospho-N-acetylmuramoyl-pentapeptide-transferase [Breznakia sp. PH5-24]